MHSNIHGLNSKWSKPKITLQTKTIIDKGFVKEINCWKDEKGFEYDCVDPEQTMATQPCKLFRKKDTKDSSSSVTNYSVQPSKDQLRESAAMEMPMMFVMPNPSADKLAFDGDGNFHLQFQPMLTPTLQDRTDSNFLGLSTFELVVLCVISLLTVASFILFGYVMGKQRAHNQANVDPQQRFKIQKSQKVKS